MAQQQQQPGGEENALAPLWITIGLFAVAGLIWWMAREYIVLAIFQLRIYEIHLISFFTNKLDWLNALLQNIPRSAYTSITFNDLVDYSARVGEYLRYPISAILAILAIMLFLSDATLRFKKKYSMKSLLESESTNWAQITPVLGLDLVNTKLDEGPWAMSMPPMAFAKKHKLLREKRVEPSEEAIIYKARPMVSVIKNEAKRLFALQIGPYWKGPENLNPHTKALFAIFAARANRDSEAAKKLSDQIALSTISPKLDFSGVDAVLKKYKDTKVVTRITNRHAYVQTVMASMLKLARTDGVFPAAEILWVKPIDRRLWFMLNTVGRQTSFPEVAGPFAHWLAELEFGRRLIVPMVDEAVKGLEIAIHEIIYVPDEED